MKVLTLLTLLLKAVLSSGSNHGRADRMLRQEICGGLHILRRRHDKDQVFFQERYRSVLLLCGPPLICA